ncbi:MAG: hypothetical protein PVI86_02175 [Phycisphaerae bacterium]
MTSTCRLGQSAGINIAMLMALCFLQAPTGADGSDQSADELPKQTDPSRWALKNVSECSTAAEKLVGKGSVPNRPGKAEMVTLATDRTPFLSRQVVGRPVWQVVIEDWKVRLSAAPRAVEDTYTRTLDVFLDAQSGRVLRIASRWPEGMPRTYEDPTTESATAQLRAGGNERYHGFPETPPVVTFEKAVDATLLGGANPLEAKQIDGQYVAWSRMGREPQPVWAITLWGMPPFQAAYPGVPANARNHMRYIIDAKSGRWLYASTAPQPPESQSRVSDRGE